MYAPVHYAVTTTTGIRSTTVAHQFRPHTSQHVVAVGRDQKRTADPGHVERCGERQDVDRLVSEAVHVHAGRGRVLVAFGDTLMLIVAGPCSATRDRATC